MHLRLTKGATTLGGDAVRLTLSKVVTLCITLASTMLLFRFRAFQEYGTHSELLLVINLVSALLMLGLPNSINYFLARTDTQEERREFLSLYYILSTVISVVIGIVLVLAIPLIELYFKNNTIRTLCCFLTLYPWLSMVSSSTKNVLVVYKKARKLIAYRIVHSIAVLASVLVVQWLGLNVSAYMISFASGNSLFALIVYYFAFKIGGGFTLTIDKRLICSIFTFAIPMGLVPGMGTLNAEVDKRLISI